MQVAPTGFPIRASDLRFDVDVYALEYSRSHGERPPLFNLHSDIRRGNIMSCTPGGMVGFPTHPELFRASFPAPRGASGAPVFARGDFGPPRLVGMILGHHETRAGDEQPVSAALVLPAPYIAEFLTEIGHAPHVLD